MSEYKYPLHTRFRYYPIIGICLALMTLGLWIGQGFTDRMLYMAFWLALLCHGLWLEFRWQTRPDSIVVTDESLVARKRHRRDVELKWSAITLVSVRPDMFHQRPEYIRVSTGLEEILINCRINHFKEIENTINARAKISQHR